MTQGLPLPQFVKQLARCPMDVIRTVCPSPALPFLVFLAIKFWVELLSC